MKPNLTRRGVTFLEIMVVVVIMGILVAVALPSMRGPAERTALRTSARDFVAAGLSARQTAIVERHNTFLLLHPKDRTWRIHLTPPMEKRYTWAKQEREPTLADEILRSLPQYIDFKQVRHGDEKLELGEDEIELTFYPNGSCSGMAIEVGNTRNRSLTVEFDEATGRPEVYAGEPKTMAAKLREQGIDPAAYGLQEDAVAAKGTDAGSGFKRTAGMNEDERVKYYEDAVQRMISRSRNKYESDKNGAGAAYAGAAAWGGRK